jgi:hypothetical protein
MPMSLISNHKQIYEVHFFLSWKCIIVSEILLNSRSSLFFLMKHSQAIIIFAVAIGWNGGKL